MAAASASQRRVLPSMSVKRKVTRPVGGSVIVASASSPSGGPAPASILSDDSGSVKQLLSVREGGGRIGLRAGAEAAEEVGQPGRFVGPRQGAQQDGAQNRQLVGAPLRRHAARALEQPGQRGEH